MFPAVPSTQPSAGHAGKPTRNVFWVHLHPLSGGEVLEAPVHALVAVSVVIKPLYFSNQSQIVVNDIKHPGPDVQFQAGGSDWNSEAQQEVSDSDGPDPQLGSPTTLTQGF